MPIGQWHVANDNTTKTARKRHSVNVQMDNASLQMLHRNYFARNVICYQLKTALLSLNVYKRLKTYNAVQSSLKSQTVRLWAMARINSIVFVVAYLWTRFRIRASQQRYFFRPATDAPFIICMMLKCCRAKKIPLLRRPYPKSCSKIRYYEHNGIYSCHS